MDKVAPNGHRTSMTYMDRFEELVVNQATEFYAGHRTINDSSFIEFANYVSREHTIHGGLHSTKTVAFSQCLHYKLHCVQGGPKMPLLVVFVCSII